MTAQEILDLNKDAHQLLSSMIKEQFDRRNILISSQVGEKQAYLEYSYQDGTLIELAVVSDPKNNKPIEVVLNHYYECNNFYTRLFTETFEVS